MANQTERSNASSEEPPDPETAATSETAANNQGGSKEPKNKIPTESETTSTEFIQTQMPLADNPEADNYLENELDEPWPGDFNVPADDEEMEAMIEAMVAIGMQCREAELVIKARKKDYNDALKKFKADSKKRMPKKDARRGRQQKK